MFGRTWEIQKLFKFKSNFRRKPIRRNALELEQLEERCLFATNITQYHVDNQSTGANLTETQLTSSNVNAADFGKLYSTTLDGQVYAEPLVMTNVTIVAGANTVGTPGTYDAVVFVATEGDSLYAINAANGAVLWHRSFLDLSAADSLPNAASVTTCPTGTEPLNGNPAISSTSISPQVGITSTPVIDPSTNVLYVNVETMEKLNNSSIYYVQRLHAINLDNGTDAAAPYVIGTTAVNLNGTATDGNVNTTNISVAGSGDGNVNGVVQFNALRQLNRPGLSLVNGNVYVEWASDGDENPYHGWVVSWNVSSLSTQGMVLSGVLCTDPNGGEGGIWGGGGGLTWDPDEANTFYFETGNGDPRGGNPPLNAQGFPADDSYYESLIKVVLNSSTQASPNANGWGMGIVDYFTPSNVNALDAADEDFGSGAPLVLPDSAGIPGYPHLIVAAGKDGRIFLLNRDNLGKFNATGDNVLNSVYNPSTGVYTAPTLINGSLSTPAYYHGVLYWVSGFNNDAKAFIIAPIANPTEPYDVATVEPISETADNNFGYVPGSVEVSANGGEDPQDAVVWIMDTAFNELRAYSALSLSTQLWFSGVGSIGTVKFATPDIANGRVFVGTQTGLMAFGLTGASTPIHAPNAVSNLSASALSGSAVELNWTDSTASPNFATNYAIQMATSASGPFNTVANAVQESMTYPVTGLTQNTTYYFKIVSSNSAGSSSPSAPAASATTTNQTGQTPTAPIGLGAVPASGSEVYLNWTNTATNATGFTLIRATDSLFTQNVNTLPIASAPYYYTDFAAGLSPGNTYYYKIQAFNSAGLSSSSNTASVSIPNVPPAPTNAVAVVNGNQVELSWTDHAGPFALGYQISRSVDGGPYAIYADRPETSDSPPSTQTYFDANVPLGHTYSYEIVAENVSGFSVAAYASVSILGTATVNLDNAGNLSLTVSPGAPDRLVVNLASGNYTLTDGAVTLSVTGAGAGLVAGNGTSAVTIPAADISNMTLDTGDNTDSITVVNDAVPITITADSGGGTPTINLGDPVNNSTISGTITNLSNGAITISGSGTTNVTGNLVSGGGVAIFGSGTVIISGNVNIGLGNLTDTGSGTAAVNGIVTGSTALPGLIEGQQVGNIDTIDPPSALYGTDVVLYPYMGETAGGDHAIVATSLHTWATNDTWIYQGQINIGNTNGTGTGTVSFAQSIDGSASIKIDGTSVLYDTAFTNTIGTGPITLTAGWHNIDIRFANGSGGTAGADGQNNNGWTGWTQGNANPLSGIGFVYRVDTGPNDPLGQATGGNVANYVIPTDNGTGNLFRAGAPGGVVMDGSGTLTLSGNNTYLGTTTIDAGKLVVENNNALSTANGGAVSINGGTLALPGTGGISLAGNPISINGHGAGQGAIENLGLSNTVNNPITVATAAEISSDAGLLTLAGNITINAPLTFIGAGNTTVSGIVSGTASTAGLLESQDYGNINTTSSGNPALGSDIVSTTVMAESNVYYNASVPLNPTAAHIWGNNDTWIYTGQIFLGVGNTYRFYLGVDDDSYLAIDGNALFNGNDGGGQVTSGIAGDNQWHNFNARFSSHDDGGAGPVVDPGGFTLTSDGSTPTANSPAPTDNGSGNLFRISHSLTTAGSGVVTLSNTNTYLGPTYVAGGTLLVDGSQPGSNVTVDAGAILGGTGSVGTVMVDQGGMVTGNLNAAGVTFAQGSTFAVQLNGAAAGQYTQLNTAGEVNLGNTTLTLANVGGFAIGQQFVVVQAASLGATTFSNLPDGSIISSAGQAFVVHYVNDQQVTLTVLSGPSQFVISNLSSTSITAGNTVTFTVTDENGSNQPVTNYTGTIQISSSDSQATWNSSALPSTYTFTSTDAGAHTFTVTLASAGSQTITLSDTRNSNLTITTTPITVTAANFDHFAVNILGSNTVVAGDPFLFTVQAEDKYDNPVSSYSGTTAVTAKTSPTDSQSNFPMSGTLQISGIGFGFYQGDLKTVGTYTISVIVGSNSVMNMPLTVMPAAANYFTVAAPATATTDSAVSITVTAYDPYGNVATGYNGTVKLTSTDPAAVFPVNNYTFTTTGGSPDEGVHTFTAVFKSPGSQTITATDIAQTHPVLAGTSSATVVAGLEATGITPTPTGFTVNFNKAFDPSTLKLYGTTLNNPGLLFYMTNSTVGPTLLTGSVVPNATDTAFTFVETTFADANGGLPNGLYDVSLLSSANGLKDSSGLPLQTANTSNTAPNLYNTQLGQSVPAYSNSFTLSTQSAFTDTTQGVPTQVALSLPAFAQGPGLAVHVQVHNSGGAGGIYPGIPATISDGNKASTVSFSVTYNTALLTVTGGVVDPSILSSSPNATFSRTATGVPVGGMETDAFTFSTGNGSLLAKGSAWTLGDITASVPNAPGQQIYKDKQLLTVSNISSDGATNGGVTNANLVGGSGFEVVAYLGDASGDGNIQLNDATIANNVGNEIIGGGFSAYPMVDPVVLADTDGAGFVDSSTVGNIASLAIGHAQPTIPTPPSGRITAAGGADPDLSLPDQVTPSYPPFVRGGAGGVVEVPVNLNNAMPADSTGLTEATLDLTYDPSIFNVSAADVHLGSLPSQGTGWTVWSMVNQAAGQLVIQLYSLTPLAVSAAGSLVTVDFHTVPGAHGTGSVSLVDWANPTGQVWVRTSLSDANGALTLGQSTGQTTVSGAWQVARGESSQTAVAATTFNQPAGGLNSEPAAQARDSVAALACASNLEIVSQAGSSGVPLDPPTSADPPVFQFGNAPLITDPALVTPFQLLTTEIFSELARQTNSTEDQGAMENLLEALTTWGQGC